MASLLPWSHEPAMFVSVDLKLEVLVAFSMSKYSESPFICISLTMSSNFNVSTFNLHSI